METITLSISEFLDILWGIKEFSVCDIPLGKKLASSPLAHVEFPPLRQLDGSLSTSSNVCRVWRKKSWESDYRQYLLSKELAEKRSADWERIKATRLKVMAGLGERLSLDEKTAESVALNLMKGDKMKIIEKIQQLLNITLREDEF